MKSLIIPILGFAAALTMPTDAQVSTPSSGSTISATPYSAKERAPSSRVMQRILYEPGLRGEGTVPRIHQYTAICSGMHYALPDGTFAESDPSFAAPSPDSRLSQTVASTSFACRETC